MVRLASTLEVRRKLVRVVVLAIFDATLALTGVVGKVRLLDAVDERGEAWVGVEGR